MADEKVLFFDIDGTLVNFDTTIPASTITALRLARENGHKLILCTGRSLGQLQGAIKELSFDGGVLAAGAYVRYQNQVIDATTIPGEKLRNIWSFIDEEKLPYIVQCVDHTATERSVKAHLFDVMEHKYEVDEKQFSTVFANMEFVESKDDFSHVEKVLYYDTSYTVEEIREKLGSQFDVVPMSFMKDGTSSGEITQAGINKAYGMEKLLTYLGKTREDAIAFGDGPNDLEMLSYAGIGVAMGNADDSVKEKADMVTARIDEDGIFLALRKLKIID